MRPAQSQGRCRSQSIEQGSRSIRFVDLIGHRCRFSSSVPTTCGVSGVSIAEVFLQGLGVSCLGLLREAMVSQLEGLDPAFSSLDLLRVRDVCARGEFGRHRPCSSHLIRCSIGNSIRHLIEQRFSRHFRCQSDTAVLCGLSRRAEVSLKSNGLWGAYPSGWHVLRRARSCDTRGLATRAGLRLARACDGRRLVTRAGLRRARSCDGRGLAEGLVW